MIENHHDNDVADETIGLTDAKPIWCKGCGHYAILKALTKALVELNRRRSETAIISGIGCSSRLPGYVNCFGFNTIHGRALPTAVGVKMRKPTLTVLAVGGDGDMMGIGLGHLAHAARKNMDVTCVIMDNHIYGLTKGQTSPTTPLDVITVTHPYGSIDPPLDPAICALTFGATWVARGGSTDPKTLADLAKKAILHPGFSVLHVVSPCLSFQGRADVNFLRERCAPLEEEHDASSLDQALTAARNQSPFRMGLLFETTGANYEVSVGESKRIADHLGPADMGEILEIFIPRKSLDVDLERKGDVVVFALRGKLNAETVDQFHKDVIANIGAGESLVFDMSELTFLSSAGLRALLECRKKIAESGAGKIVLCAAHAEVEKTLIISGFNKIFTHVESIDEALKSNAPTRKSETGRG